MPLPMKKAFSDEAMRAAISFILSLCDVTELITDGRPDESEAVKFLISGSLTAPQETAIDAAIRHITAA